MKNRWMVFAVVGIEFAVAVSTGLLAGDWIDAKMANQTPYMTVAGLILGTVCGMILLFRTLGRFG
ncbi:AtpZ/AtpI family protein [Candidatus Mycalebacterium sp.]